MDKALLSRRRYLHVVCINPLTDIGRAKLSIFNKLAPQCVELVVATTESRTIVMSEDIDEATVHDPYGADGGQQSTNRM
jgi:hypothetical protein